MEQLYFEILDNELYISKTCEECKNKCKIYCLSKDAEVYCKKYNKERKNEKI